MSCRHIVTSEYPPIAGGVSDYTRLLAAELARAGEDVHVWCPAAQGETPGIPGVRVHRIFRNFGLSDLLRAGSALDGFAAPRRLLVQWVPHGYRWKSMNLPFCFWLWRRAVVHRDRIEVMFHEAGHAFGEGGWRQDVAAAAHRLMAFILLRACRKAWISIPAWEDRLRPWVDASRRIFEWLPIPSNIPLVDDPAGAAEVRRHYARRGEFLIGHFGTYSAVAGELIAPVLKRSIAADQVLLFIGNGSTHFRDRLAASANTVFATGPLDHEDVSRHISACDVFLQPYPDGVSTRRGSAMACLSHGKPVITTRGHLTEPLWLESGAVMAFPAGDAAAAAAAIERLRGDRVERARLGVAARQFYEKHFGIDKTVRALRRDDEATTAAPPGGACASRS